MAYVVDVTVIQRYLVQTESADTAERFGWAAAKARFGERQVVSVVAIKVDYGKEN